MKTARDHRNSTALGRGSVGTVAATIFVSTLTLLSTEASALDINGLAAWLSIALASWRILGAPFRNADGAETRPGFNDADDQDLLGL